MTHINIQEWMNGVYKIGTCFLLFLWAWHTPMDSDRGQQVFLVVFFPLSRILQIAQFSFLFINNCQCLFPAYISDPTRNCLFPLSILSFPFSFHSPNYLNPDCPISPLFIYIRPEASNMAIIFPGKESYKVGAGMKNRSPYSPAKYLI